MTLDADVASDVERIRKTDGKGFKRALNDLVRAGVKVRDGQITTMSRPSPIHPVDLGGALLDVTSGSRAIDFAEGEDHK